MSEAADRGGVARLDELAEVTKAYATYSRRAFGVAFVALGAWMAAALAVRVVSFPWSAILLAFAPLAWVLVVPPARAYYQRRGRVIEAEDEASGCLLGIAFPVFLWTYALLVPSMLWSRHRAWASASGGWAWAGLLLGMAAFPVAAAWARKRLEGSVDKSFLFLPAIFAIQSRGDGGTLSTISLGTTVLAAFFLMGKGAYDHLAFRRLEGRLAALKGGAP